MGEEGFYKDYLRCVDNIILQKVFVRLMLKI